MDVASFQNCIKIEGMSDYVIEPLDAEVAVADLRTMLARTVRIDLMDISDTPINLCINDLPSYNGQKLNHIVTLP